MDQEALKRVTKARANLVLDAPFFGSLSLRLTLKEDQSCKTAWVDGKAMGYNPEFIKSLSMDELKGVIAHEVMHLACCHHTRMQARDAQKWNAAGDYAINSILEESKFVLPKGRLRESQFDGKSAEEIYNLIPNQNGNGQGNQGTNGQGQGQDNDPGQCGEVKPFPGENGQASESELAQAEGEAKIAVTQAATQAKACGKLPGAIAKLVDSLVNPKVAWQDVLRRFVQQSARNDYSWSRPNRRFIANGLYLPSLHSQDLGKIVLAIDTSGSIGENDLIQFASELTAILEEFPSCEVQVIYCDAQVNYVQVYQYADLPLQLTIHGGGGTRFSPVFDHVDAEGETPTCLIYLTDLQCSDYPEYAPSYPVLWVTTEDHYRAPYFGEVIEM